MTHATKKPADPLPARSLKAALDCLLADEYQIRILKNLATAIDNSGARIAILEMLLNPSKPDFVGISFDMQMFTGTRAR